MARSERGREPKASVPPFRADRPLVLGHRGASAEAPENTLAAFRLAIAQGADGVELDVWRCATGEVVVAHDEDLVRVGRSPLRLPDAPLAVLAALPDAVVNVELKSRGAPDLGLAQAVAEVIWRAGAGGRVIVSSFDWRLVAAFRLASPGVATGLLFEDAHAWRLRTFLAVRSLRPAAVHPDRVLATDARVRRWAARGLAVNVWTVDDPAEAARLARAGATAIITNAPAPVRAAVEAG